MKEYFELLQNHKFTEAQKYRKKLVPKKLVKYVSLTNDNESNEKKFFSLENNMAWFSSIKALNDPYEFTLRIILRVTKANGQYYHYQMQEKTLCLCGRIIQTIIGVFALSIQLKIQNKSSLFLMSRNEFLLPVLLRECFQNSNKHIENMNR